MSRVPLPIRGHGDLKFPNAGVLASSNGRGWTGISVEQRSHPAGEIPAFVPSQTEVTMILAADRPSRVLRRGNGSIQDTEAIPAAIWLCPAGIPEDCIRITDPIPNVLHMYVPETQFRIIAREHGVTWSGSQALRYEAGFRDPLIEQIGRALLGELHAESSGSSMVASSLACALAARLMSQHTETVMRLPRGPTMLDAIRLKRVCDFIEGHLGEDLQLVQLASVAALSQFHFLRAFKASTGVAPSRYLAHRRLERAKQLLKERELSLAEIALACSFSSQANFSRAFTRETGISPGRYRREVAR